MVHDSISERYGLNPEVRKLLLETYTPRFDFVEKHIHPRGKTYTFMQSENGLNLREFSKTCVLKLYFLNYVYIIC